VADAFRVVVSGRLRTAINLLRGPVDASRWLDDLPERVDQACRRWGLTPLAVAEDGAMSCCVYATGRDGGAVVLKIPHEAEAGRLEAIALARWSVSGASPAVLALDESLGELLMERVLPGTVAWPDAGPEASNHLADLLSRLYVGDAADPAVEGVLVDVVEMRLGWADERFEETENVTGLELVRAARAEASALLAGGGRDGILHGDLQPKNILVGPGGNWFVIDPFACRGDRHADAAFWAVMQNSPTTIGRRIAELATATGLGEARLHGWARVFAVAELRPYLPDSAARMVAFLGEGAGIGGLSGDAVGRLAAVAGLHRADVAPGSRASSGVASGLVVPVALFVSFFGMGTTLDVAPESSLLDIRRYWGPWLLTVAAMGALVGASIWQYRRSFGPRPDADGPTLVSAHRGGVGEARERENTREALEAACGTACEYVEFDVQRLADGTLVLFHCDVLNVAGEAVPLGGIDLPTFREWAGHFLLYEDALRILRGRKKAHIDLKFVSPRDLAGTVWEIEATRRAIEIMGVDDIIVTTLEDESVRLTRAWARSEHPTLLIGLSLGRSAAGMGLGETARLRWREAFPGRRMRACDANLVVANKRLAKLTLGRYARRNRLPLLVWTVDEAKDLRYWLQPNRAWLVTTNRPADALEIRRSVRSRRTVPPSRRSPPPPPAPDWSKPTTATRTELRANTAVPHICTP